MGHIFRPESSAFAAVADPSTMAEQVMTFAPASDAEALKLLRESFPDRPLWARVAALALLTQRQSGDAGYSPR